MLEVLGEDQVAELVSVLTAAHVRVLRRTFVDSAAVIRSKQVPVKRAGALRTRRSKPRWPVRAIRWSSCARAPTCTWTSSSFPTGSGMR